MTDTPTDWTTCDVGTPQTADIGFADRWILVRQFGYALVPGALADALAQLIGQRSALEAGSGCGYLAAALRYRGVRLRVNDASRQDDNPYRFLVMHCEPDDVSDGADCIRKHNPDVLILSWPNHETDFAARCARALRPGGLLIYCGYARGGYTASADFFDILNDDFELNVQASRFLNARAMSYEDMRDKWFVFEKKTHV